MAIGGIGSAADSGISTPQAELYVAWSDSTVFTSSYLDTNQ